MVKYQSIRMGFILSSIKRAPDRREAFVTKAGLAVERFYLWVQATTRNVDRLNTGDTYYDDLADLQAKIQSPIIGQKAMVEGQGLAVYNKSSTWVKARNDTAPIT